MDLIASEFERYADCADQAALKGATFLITGAKGYLASSLIRFLSYINAKFGLGLFVYATTRDPSDRPEYAKGMDDVEYVAFDSFDSREYARKIDYVVHAAAPTSRLTFINDPLGTFDAINDGTRRALEFARRNGVKSMLYLSSVEVYGSPKVDEPVKESDFFALDPTEIRNCYPLGKKVAEYLCNVYHRKFDLPVNVVRPSSVQGLFQPYSEDRIFNQILRCLIERKDFVFKTDGETAKTLIYAMDAVAGMLTILTSGVSGETYNLTDRRTFMKMKDVVRAVFDRFAPELRVTFDLEDDAKTGYIAPLSYDLSTDKLERLGWRPRTDLFEIYEIDLARFLDA